MLDAFEAWCEANRPRFAHSGVSVEYIRPELNKLVIRKESARVVFETEDFIADVIVWDTGECDLEVLHCETSDQLLRKTYEFGTVEDMASELDRVREYLLALFEGDL